MTVHNWIQSLPYEQLNQLTWSGVLQYFQTYMIKSTKICVLIRMFYHKWFSLSKRRTVMLFIMNFLQSHSVISHDLYSKTQLTLQSLPLYKANLGLQGLIPIRSTLSGECSVRQHFFHYYSPNYKMIAVTEPTIESITTSADSRQIIILQIFNNYIHMKQIQIKLNLKIHKVNLVVKFPCHILAILKTETQEVNVGQEVPLTLNEAILQQSASLTLNLLYDSIKQTFLDKKIEIAIYIKSSNNKIPSGYVPLNMNSLKTEKGKKKYTLNKCVDKNACVEATITYTVLSETNYQPDNERVKTEENRTGILRAIKNKPFSTKQIRIEQKNIHITNDNVDSQIQQNMQHRRLDRQRSEPDKQRWETKKSGYYRQEHHHREAERHSTTYNTENQNNYKGSQNDREYKGLLKKYDQQNAELKTVITRRDVLQKSLKESEAQFKMYKQKYENLFAQHQNYIKKAEFKQNISKDQITTLNEKLMLSESEKQKMIYQKNNLVDSFEERERNLRLNFKEKEKTFTEEKNRLVKRLENLTRQSTDAHDVTSEMGNRVNELTTQLEASKFTNNQLEVKVIELNEHISSLNNQIQEERNKQLQLEQNMSSGLELEDDKRKLRKRIAQKQQQIIKQTNTINILQANSIKSLKKYEQIQTQLKQKTAALKTLQKQMENNLKQTDNLKKNLEENQRKIDELNFFKQTELQKTENLNQQIRELTRKNQQQLRNVNYENKQRDTVIKKLNDQLNTANLTATAICKKNEDLDLQISELRKNIKKSETQNETLINLISEIENNNSKLTSSLEAQKNNKQKIQKDYKTQINNKDNIISELQQKIVKFSNQMSSKDEENYYKITDLEQKLEEFKKDNTSLLQQLKNTKNILEEIKIEKMKNANSNEDLQYTLKLKNNQIFFLKQTVQKCNQQISSSTSQIKELTLQIQRLNQNIQSLESQRENLQNILEQANFSGNETAQKLQAYKSKNKQALQKYFKSIKGGIIEVQPQHEEQEVVRWMNEAISKHNQFINQKEETISQLTFELNQANQNFDNTTSELEQTLANLDKVKDNLQKQKIKNTQRSGQAEETKKQMKLQLQTMYKTNQKLDKQLSSLNDQKKSLSQQIKLLNNNLKDKLKDITTLKTKVQDMNKTLKQQEQDYTSYNSQISNQNQQQIAKLQSSLNVLNVNLTAQTKKTQELHTKLTDVSKQYKDYQKKSEQQSKIQSNENDKLNRQLEQIRRQLQTKINALTKYEQVTQTLKGNLQKANKQNISLKEVCENIRKRNEKGASRQKQLQNIIESLKKNQITLTQKQLQQDKIIKDKSNELINSRENNIRLDREKAKLKQQYDTFKNELKQKEDLLIQNDKALKSLQGLNVILNGKLQSSERGYSDKQSSLNKEIILLKGNRQKLQEELSQLKDRYNKENKQFNQQIKELKIKNADLDSTIKSLNKSMQEQTKIHGLQDKYLTPIKEHTGLLSQQLVSCIQVCDNFEQNKNKLMKIANLKAWQFDDKFISQRIGDINFAYQRLKLNIMGNQTLNAAQYEKQSSEIKKVQAAIDRVLKGNR